MTSDLSTIAAVTNALSGQVLEINKELVLSTAHIPQWIAEAMDNYTDGKVSFAFDLVSGGYLVLVGSESYPEEMAQAIALAQFNGCKWLRFDADGPELKSLPRWNW